MSLLDAGQMTFQTGPLNYMPADPNDLISYLRVHFQCNRSLVVAPHRLPAQGPSSNLRHFTFHLHIGSLLDSRVVLSKGTVMLSPERIIPQERKGCLS